MMYYIWHSFLCCKEAWQHGHLGSVLINIGQCYLVAMWHEDKGHHQLFDLINIEITYTIYIKHDL